MTGCYVSKDGDKLLVPGVYETADEFHAKRLQAVSVNLLILFLCYGGLCCTYACYLTFINC